MAYIPNSHHSYNLLPMCAARGGEVFAYSSTIPLEECLREYLPLQRTLDPYGYKSYDEYDQVLIQLLERYREYPEAIRAINHYRLELSDLNQKEKWSVCRYVGKEVGGIMGLTCGRTYYWPCSASAPRYIGVIDDEEFTNYWYSPNPKFWLIVCDPTGMAAKTMIYYQETRKEKKLAAITDKTE